MGCVHSKHSTDISLGWAVLKKQCKKSLPYAPVTDRHPPPSTLPPDHTPTTKHASVCRGHPNEPHWEIQEPRPGW